MYFDPTGHDIAVRSIYEARKYEVIWNGGSVNRTTITIRKPDGDRFTLREGTDYYIGKDNKAYFYSTVKIPGLDDNNKVSSSGSSSSGSGSSSKVGSSNTTLSPKASEEYAQAYSDDKRQNGSFSVLTICDYSNINGWSYFDSYLPEWSQARLKELNKNYVNDVALGGYNKIDIYDEAMALRNQLIDNKYLNYAVKDFASFGITEGDYQDKLGLNDHVTYAQALYSYTIGLQESSSTKYMERNSDGSLTKEWLNAYTKLSEIGNTISSIISGIGALPKNIYNSIKEAPKYPDDFQSVKNGTTKNNINNQQLLEELRQTESGKWQKVYKDGYSKGKKVSIHYFESPSGKVFDVDVKSGWSNPSSGR